MKKIINISGIIFLNLLLVTLAGCDKSPSDEMQQEFDEGDRIQAEMEGRMNQAIAQQDSSTNYQTEGINTTQPVQVVENDFDCPEDIPEESSECAGYLQEKFMSLGLGIVTFGAEEIKYKELFGNTASVTLPNPGNNYFVVGLGGKKRFLVLREKKQLSEFDSIVPWLLLDRQSGNLTNIIGKPSFSSNGMNIVVHNQDLEMEVLPNILDIYTVYGYGLERSFQGVKDGDTWGPENVEWDGDDAIFFDQLTINTEIGGERYKRKKMKLARVNGAWQMH